MNYYLVQYINQVVELSVYNGLRYIERDGEITVISRTTNAANIIIPEKIDGAPVTAIGNSAFAQDWELRGVTLPNSVTEIKAGAFRGCRSLGQINMPASLKRIGEMAFFENRALPSIAFPEGLLEIGNSAFNWNSGMTELVLPASLLRLGSRAFADTGLTTVKINGNPSFIDTVNNTTPTFHSTFDRCRSLTEVYISNTVTSLGGYMFSSCSALETVALPPGLTVIPTGLFYRTGLKTLRIPSGVTLIGAAAFLGCMGLELLIIPESVVTIGIATFNETGPLIVCIENSFAHQFARNNNLDYLLVANIDDDVEIGRYGSFQYITANNEVTILSCDRDATGELIVPEKIGDNTVTRIASYSFEGCNQITKISLPETVTEIGAGAFRGNSTLAEINIPSGVTVIRNHTFYLNHALALTELPPNLTEIGEWAFYNVFGTNELVLPASLIRIGNEAFAHTGLRKVEIQGNPSLGSNIFRNSIFLSKVILADTLTVGFGGSGLFMGSRVLETVVLPSAMTIIPGSMFASTGLNPSALKELIIPSGVTEIRWDAFRNCANLEKIIIPRSVVSIDNTAFIGAGRAVIHCYRDSYAHQFAVQHGIHYQLIGADIPDIATSTDITGTVTTVAGIVVEGAEVELLDAGGEVVETTTTDASGEYEFKDVELGRYTLRAEDESERLGTEQISVRRMTVFDVIQTGNSNITVKSSSSISGKVTDGTNGIAGAEVTLSDRDANVVASAVTGTDGSYEIPNVPNGTYTIRAVAGTGSAAKEITLFNDTATVNITIVPTEASVSGTVTHNGTPAANAGVILYDMRGFAAAGTRTGADGTYVFTPVPHGAYTVCAVTEDAGADTLTGYAVVTVGSDSPYTADIALTRPSAGSARIEGQVVLQGGNERDTVVTLRDIFGNEHGVFTTGPNGKYSFRGVGDGIYMITAVTLSDGGGYTTVTVRNGAVTGNPDIAIRKGDGIAALEKRIQDIKDNLDKTEAIAVAKTLYDGLSEKEKLEISPEAAELLNGLIDEEVEYEVIIDDDTAVTVENLGLVISAEEIADGADITFDIRVEETEAVDLSGGIRTEEEYIQSLIYEAAEDKDILAYYKIGMTKFIDGNDKEINTFSKDTDTTGEITVTIEIPENRRGRGRYTVAHVHNGQVYILQNIRARGDKVTVRVSGFSTFVLMADDYEHDDLSDEAYEPGQVLNRGTVTVADASLAFRGLLGLVTLTAPQADAAKLGETGVELNIGHVLRIFRFALGLSDHLINP
jgi:hypothetical protein